MIALADTGPRTLGEFFRKMREDRGLGLRQAVINAEAKGFTTIKLNRLGDLERDKTKKAPAPEFLHELAKLYDQPYAVIAARVLERYGQSDLVSQPSELQRKAQEDRTNANREIARLSERYISLHEGIQRLTTALYELLAEQSPEALNISLPDGKRARKTGRPAR